MIFDSESVFEENVITVLKQHGWKDGVLRYPTERDLLDNWKDILYRNNNDIDRLGKYPLTDGEMAQIIEQIETLRTPLALNSFVNGRTVSITRDNKEDVAHFGKEVSLYIYDRKEIAGGKSTYQIVQQPVYPAKNTMLSSRRGDLVLLINGMPLIHIELKRSGIPVSQATNQIEKYAHEGVFTGLFRLVQIFVAMTPDDAVLLRQSRRGQIQSKLLLPLGGLQQRAYLWRATPRQRRMEAVHRRHFRHRRPAVHSHGAPAHRFLHHRRLGGWMS